MSKKRESIINGALVQAALLLAVFIVCYFPAITVLTPARYQVIAGDVATQNIASPRTTEYSAETEIKRDIARNAVKPIYILDENKVKELSSAAEKFFTDIDTLRVNALDAVKDTDLYQSQKEALSISEWQSILPEENLNALLADFGLPISTDEGRWLLNAEKYEILRLNDAVLAKLKTALASGLEESQYQARKALYIKELQATSIADPLKRLGEKVFDAYFKPTYVIDEFSTQQAREAAAAEVEPVEIKKGDTIVKAGSTITQQQYELMRSLELIRSDNADIHLNVGVIIYMLCIVAAMAAYLILFQKQIFASKKQMLIIAAAIALSMLLSLLSSMFDKRISTALIGVLLIALLVDRKAAIAVNMLLALSLGLLAGGRGTSMLGYESMVKTISIMIGGQVAIYFIGRDSKRGSVITAGLFAGLAAALVVLATGIMTSKTIGTILLNAAWALGSDLIASVLVLGTLTLWENLFDVATAARLNELSNTNNALLRQLMTEAPGTYHHSMMVAALAESAAEEIDANALLARVGAYYHDVGKLRRPLYFKENQMPNENIHDTLPAGESAMIIISHQKDGIALLAKNKLPSAVMQIAYEHHGTTLMAYFYHKAMQENGGKPIPQKLFRYAGARPSTRESVIVMLADSTEAAVRSLASPSREEVEGLLDKVFKGKIDDGQLALSSITFRELTLIRQSFLRTLNGMMHERIAYPGQQVKKEALK